MDTHVDRLADRGEQQVGDGRVGLEHVGVDTEQRDLTAGVADHRCGALVDRATDGQEHVDTLVDEALRGVDRVLVRSEATGEDTVGAVPAEHLDGVALLLVPVLDALLEAVHEDRDGREVHSTERADLLGRGVRRRRVAGEERGLGGVEDDRLDVLGIRRAVEVVVHDVVDRDELDVGVGDGRLARSRRQREADRDDERAVLVDEARDVRREVGLRVGLDRRRTRRPARPRQRLDALESELVERLVVEPAGVGDHAGLEAVDGAARGFALSGCRLGCRPAAGEGYEQSGGGNYPDELLGGRESQLTPPSKVPRGLRG